jgi:hypothetical protein
VGGAAGATRRARGVRRGRRTRRRTTTRPFRHPPPLPPARAVPFPGSGAASATVPAPAKPPALERPRRTCGREPCRDAPAPTWQDELRPWTYASTPEERPRRPEPRRPWRPRAPLPSSGRRDRTVGEPQRCGSSGRRSPERERGPTARRLEWADAQALRAAGSARHRGSSACSSVSPAVCSQRSTPTSPMPARELPWPCRREQAGWAAPVRARQPRGPAPPAWGRRPLPRRQERRRERQARAQATLAAQAAQAARRPRARAEGRPAAREPEPAAPERQATPRSGPGRCAQEEARADRDSRWGRASCERRGGRRARPAPPCPRGRCCRPPAPRSYGRRGSRRSIRDG